jgi:hypothetical protein
LIVTIHFTGQIKSLGSFKSKLKKAHTFQTQSTNGTDDLPCPWSLHSPSYPKTYSLTETETPSLFSNRRNASASNSTVATTTTCSTSPSSAEIQKLITQQPNLSARTYKMKLLKIKFTTLASMSLSTFCCRLFR